MPGFQKEHQRTLCVVMDTDAGKKGTEWLTSDTKKDKGTQRALQGPIWDFLTL